MRFLRRNDEPKGKHAVGTADEMVDADHGASKLSTSPDGALPHEMPEHTSAQTGAPTTMVSDERKQGEMTTSGADHDRIALADSAIHAPADAHDPGMFPDAPVPTIPAPVVLLGNPRLGSNPAGYPRVWGPTPDSVLDGVHVANLTVRTASLRGDDHRFAEETRQDSVGLWTLDASKVLGTDQVVLLACVADGVGEHKLSHLGSARACLLLRQHVEAHLLGLLGQERHLTMNTCERVIAEVASGLRSFADESRLEPKDLSTTLFASLIIPEPVNTDGWVARSVLFGVGDSSSFTLRERTWLGVPERTADEEGVLSTKTDALPASPDRCRVSMSVLYAGDMLMICTDGLGRPLEKIPAVRDQLAAWWCGRAPSLPEFYWQMSFRAQTYGDDRSAVCIWLDEGS